MYAIKKDRPICKVTQYVSNKKHPWIQPVLVREQDKTDKCPICDEEVQYHGIIYDPRRKSFNIVCPRSYLVEYDDDEYSWELYQEHYFYQIFEFVEKE